MSASWSLILASRNGEDTLPLTLDALAKVERPNGAVVQIVLVDNASTDGTGRLLRTFADSHGALFLDEPRRGKSFALNTAIDRATGDMLVFTDDDTIPEPGWLLAYESALETFPDAGVFAGQIRPHWLAPPPKWLEYLASIGRACACTDEQAPAGPYAAMHVKGPNFAIRKAALGEQRFDTGASNFGAGTRPVGGCDSRLARDLESTGIVHVPEAIVRHVISADEMALRNVVGRFMRIGRNGAAMSGRSPAGLVVTAAKVPAFGLLAIGMLGLRRTNSAALWMAKGAIQLGQLDYHLRGSGR